MVGSYICFNDRIAPWNPGDICHSILVCNGQPIKLHLHWTSRLIKPRPPLIWVVNHTKYAWDFLLCKEVGGISWTWPPSSEPLRTKKGVYDLCICVAILHLLPPASMCNLVCLASWWSRGGVEVVVAVVDMQTIDVNFIYNHWGVDLMPLSLALPSLFRWRCPAWIGWASLEPTIGVSAKLVGVLPQMQCNSMPRWIASERIEKKPNVYNLLVFVCQFIVLFKTWIRSSFSSQSVSQSAAKSIYIECSI